MDSRLPINSLTRSIGLLAGRAVGVRALPQGGPASGVGNVPNRETPLPLRRSRDERGREPWKAKAARTTANKAGRPSHVLLHRIGVAGSPIE